MNLILRNVMFLSTLLNIGVVSSYIEIDLSHNGPVVLGANVTFTAKLFDSANKAPSGEFAYEWHDNATPQHKHDIMETNKTTVQWNISYPANQYLAREYEVTVKVFMKEIFYIQMAHQRIRFNVTETLNGKIDIEQEDLKDNGEFVSNASPVKHTIKLSEPDHNFLANNATSILTFWFVDCYYYGFSNDYSFTYNFTEERTYNIDALIVASFDKPVPTTTTTTTTTTAATPTTASTITTTTPAPTTPTTAAAVVTSATIDLTSSTTPATTVTTAASSSDFNSLNATSDTVNDTSTISDLSIIQDPTAYVPSTVSSNSSVAEEISTFASSVESLSTNKESVLPILSRLISNETMILQKRHIIESISRSVILNKTKNLTSVNNILQFACLNSTFIPPDPNKTYGYFGKQITSKAPISKVTVKGNNWLQFGDVLNLNITCNGSAKFQHCTKIKIGVHNVTGEETCSAALERDVCDFTLTHYFREANTYTYIIVIANDVSKVVTPAVIRMYKVTVQPQLSVIVVPVTCSLLAVIIIVFGVAYYVQSQNRYTVEVADFDFGQANDMEYKSFYERLREDISNMFSRSGDFLDQANVLPRRKYDNMEES